MVHGIEKPKVISVQVMLDPGAQKMSLGLRVPSDSHHFAFSFVSHVRQLLHTQGPWGAPG